MSDVEKYVLKAGIILYRSSTDICKLKKDLSKCKEKCTDTDKVGLYFSDSPMVPYGMSFEYLNLYGNQKTNSPLPAASFMKTAETKNSYFKNHQLGVFKLKKDIIFYKGKYSFRMEALGGKGEHVYNQLPTKNHNHVEDIRVLINNTDVVKEDITDCP